MVCGFFESRTFSTSGGELRGSDLRVVRYIHERNGWGSRFDGSAPGIHSGWWYCDGPGPRWFLVLAQEDFAWARNGEKKWVTKELTEREMRNALMGDARAIAAAFGAKTDDA
jgi:hypothetical protein